MCWRRTFPWTCTHILMRLRDLPSAFGAAYRLEAKNLVLMCLRSGNCFTFLLLCARSINFGFISKITKFLQVVSCSPSRPRNFFPFFFLTRHWNCVELLFVWTLLSGSTFIGMTEKKNCETRRFSEHTQRSLVWEAFVQHESRKQTKKKLLSMARGKGSEMSGNFFSFFRQFSSCSSVNKQNNINFPWIQLLGNMWKSRN